MIKLIASDLDGTLLNKQGELPEEIFPLIARLADRGILFAPASGRQYANLVSLFSPVADKVLFIAENGSLVRWQGETLYLAPLPDPAVKTILDAVRSIDGLHAVLCCPNCAYLENSVEPFLSATIPYTNREITDTLDRKIGVFPVCKVSIYDDFGATEHAMKELPPLLPAGVKIVLSGEHWCDVSAENADKGSAIKEIQNKLGFRADECMAFGDHMNDITMLDACTHSRAVANAYPELIKRAEAVIPSNEEGGVLQAISTLLKELEAYK